MALQAVIEIQRRMPKARILYVSAKGATESANLGYMQRLGLWGPGTAFQFRDDFVRLLVQCGVGENHICATVFPDTLSLGATLCISVLCKLELAL